MTNIKMANSKNELINFFRFGIIGGLGTIVNTLVFIVLVKISTILEVQNTRPLFSLPINDFYFRIVHIYIIVAFLVANIFNYSLNSRFNFSGRNKLSSNGAIKFLIIGVVACFVQIYIFSKLSQPGLFQLPTTFFDNSSGLRNIQYWSHIISILLVFPVNFIGNSIWTFRSTAPKQAK